MSDRKTTVWVCDICQTEGPCGDEMWQSFWADEGFKDAAGFTAGDASDRLDMCGECWPRVAKAFQFIANRGDR